MPNPVATAALNIARLALAEGDLDNIPDNLPQTITGPDGEPLLIPEYNVLYQTSGTEPMAAYRVVIRFSTPSGYTWTETVHTNTGASAEAVAESWSGSPQVIARNAFLSEAANLLWVQAFALDGTRLSHITKFNAKGKRAIPSGGTSDLVGATVYAQVASASGRTRAMYFRGLIDADVFGSAISNNPTASTEVQGLVNTYVQALKAAGYGWLPRKSRNDAVPLTAVNPIVKVDGQVRPGWSVVYCQNPIAVDATNRVSVHNVNKKRLPGMAGEWKAYNVSGNTFEIEYAVPYHQIATDVGGHVRAVVYDPFVLLDRVKKITGTVRKTKNAITPSRSGRSARGIRKQV